ncbi:MAG: fumarylacetoacetate hydrolase family protein [Bdellovibrionota bacterium]
MKFVSFQYQDKDHLGFSIDGKVYDVHKCGVKLNLNLPDNMKDFLNQQESIIHDVKKLHDSIAHSPKDFVIVQDPILLSPVPHPTSVRDGYAFRQHVQTMRKNRGAEMAPEFDQFPIFYYSNHNATFGPGEVLLEKDHFVRMDYELEVSVVIGKRGINIPVDKADDYIFGYMIWNDLSARCLQMEEMKLSLGPAKGKDFANTFGPYLVTKDELVNKKINTPEGEKYDLVMKARHNGTQVSEGNMKTMDWTFAQIIERASYGTELLPGDIIGSGTVGTGCYAEINSTATRKAEAEGVTIHRLGLSQETPSSLRSKVWAR